MFGIDEYDLKLCLWCVAVVAGAIGAAGSFASIASSHYPIALALMGVALSYLAVIAVASAWRILRLQHQE